MANKKSAEREALEKIRDELVASAPRPGARGAIFEDTKLYRREAIKHRFEPPLSKSTLDSFLHGLRKIAPTKRSVYYRGSDLNDLFGGAA